MTAKNKIWKLFSSMGEQKGIQLLKKIFPSLSVEIIDYESTPPVITTLDTKEKVLNRLRKGLGKITEIEASYYLEKIESREKSSQIKF